MPQTSISALTPYCTGPQFVTFYDARPTAQLLSDTDIPIPIASVPTYPGLITLLMVASGKAESIALMGGRYQPADLQALTGNSANLLAWLVAALTVPLLKQRRTDVAAPDFPQREEAQQWFAALEDGKTIFSTADAAAAGEMTDYVEQDFDVEARQLATYTAARLFGTRNNRIPEF